MRRVNLALIALTAWIPMTLAASASDVEKCVAQAIQPVMKRYGIPGVAIGVSLNGQSQVFNYGVASKADGKPVDDETLFEIGSVSKTFTATLACYAQINGRLSLSDPASKYLPALQGSQLAEVSLIQLGTHTAGGFPMQVPEAIANDDQLMRYFQRWKPTYPPGTCRTYSNLSIGLLGKVAAKSLGEEFGALMAEKLFPAFGLAHTWITLPAAQIDHCAQGYTEADAPIRLTPGILSEETYGIKTTASDLLHFVEANMKMGALDEKWQSAVADTHTGYYRVGAMTQDLIWEQYAHPTSLQDLLAGNSNEVILKPNPAAAIDPPSPPRDDVLINKTGSTNGFSTYVAFIPARKVGVVLLANKRFPIDARVTVAHEILTRLADPGPELTEDASIPIPPAPFNDKGDLVVKASPTSAAADFDFLVGKWKMHNRHLNKRLANCQEWTEFDSTDENRKILAGNNDMDTYSTRAFPGREGTLFEGLTLRLFDPKTRLWSLYWIASDTGTIDPPVVGSFENGVGHFFGTDTLDGKPIVVVFRWDARNKERPVWGQAFSADGGRTWEWNFFNVSERP